LDRTDLFAAGWQLDLSTFHPLQLKYDKAYQTVDGSFEARFYLGADTVANPWAVPVHFTRLKFHANVQKFSLPGQ
jgi:hypothetical protein